MSLRHLIGLVALVVVGAAPLTAQVGNLPPSTFARRHGEVWSEVGVRAVDRGQLVERVDQRERVRLQTRNRNEILIEAPRFAVTDTGAGGIVLEAVGGATVTMTSPRVLGVPAAARITRRLDADSLEVRISPDGSGSFRAVRHPI